MVRQPPCIVCHQSSQVLCEHRDSILACAQGVATDDNNVAFWQYDGDECTLVQVGSPFTPHALDALPSSQVHSVKLSRPVQWMSARGRVWGFQIGAKVELHQVSIGSDLGAPIYTLDLAPNSPAQCAWGWAPQVSLENSGVVVGGAHAEIQLVGKQPDSDWGVVSQVVLRKGESSPRYVCCNRVWIWNVLMRWGVVVAWHGAMMAQ